VATGIEHGIDFASGDFLQPEPRLLPRLAELVMGRQNHQDFHSRSLGISVGKGLRFWAFGKNQQRFSGQRVRVNASSLMAVSRPPSSGPMNQEEGLAPSI
jgi:hypothetical protein